MRIHAPDIFSFAPYWAKSDNPAPFLPTTRAEMDQLGWDSCDIIIVTGDAYVDHPSFGMAVMGRLLEAQGFRVGIIAQPDWRSAEPFMALGKPNLYYGVTAGNMDSMINRYTADLRMRHDDAYTAGGEGGKRPDRAVIVYSQRCKEAYRDVPVVIGGIEASLRRIAQYDYWSDKVRRSVLIDATADILLYGNAERAIVDLSHALAEGKSLDDIWNLRGTVHLRKAPPEGYVELDSSRIDWPGNIDKLPNPYDFGNQENGSDAGTACGTAPDDLADIPAPIKIVPMPLKRKEKLEVETTYIRLPSFDKVTKDPALYAHASRVLHQESNPHNARALMQKHGNREVWVNPPPIPLTTEEMDGVFGLQYQRVPHPSYGKAKIPAYDMIRFSINIMRGCFGGCTFCSITEHEGRIIQSRSHESIINEIEDIKEKVPGFTGSISDLGGPTSNMYFLNCNDDEIQSNCRKLSCVYPTICKNLNTDHSPTTELYRKARKVQGIHNVAIASGLRYDLAVRDPEYVKELVTYHVGGYLKIAPEHSEPNTLSKMMKPGMDTYYDFKNMFDRFSREAGKKQYLIPYFIAAHPGCDDEDMLSLSLWLKNNDLKVDQVQTFYPSPMSLATAMYHSEKNPLKQITYKSDRMYIPKQTEQRKAHKTLLRYHDKENWPQLRAKLKEMGRSELIGRGKECLVAEEEAPKRQPGAKAAGHGKAQPAKGYQPVTPQAVKAKKKPSKKNASQKQKPAAKAATGAKARSAQRSRIADRIKQR
ncbi:YgiQ family radical SAM protein [Aliamphritea spongicola]|uniref:YgiQ family radical SAM protein n=1 Tax=Aliamphritea spongicola TaxID=707589 RepID=UPI00196A57C6|nr:YgiQ family radical SAM protein [Aliamphritea spongicola]MBN3561651.1 YgiQ family radical SAM protein [Aliamphritea spongicola]